MASKKLSPQERLELRSVETRLAVEIARRRCRMYLASPAMDKKSAEQVLMEVLAILESAPEPITHQSGEQHG